MHRWFVTVDCRTICIIFLGGLRAALLRRATPWLAFHLRPSMLQVFNVLSTAVRQAGCGCQYSCCVAPRALLAPVDEYTLLGVLCCIGRMYTNKRSGTCRHVHVQSIRDTERFGSVSPLSSHTTGSFPWSTGVIFPGAC